MRKALALITLALLAAGAGCGGGVDASEGGAPTTKAAAPTTSTATETVTPSTTSASEESVEEFVLRVNDYYEKGQWGRAYEELHPAQKKFMSGAQFADCFGEIIDGFGSGAQMKVTEIYDEPWQIPGTKITEDSKAVTVKVFQTYSEEGQEIESELGTFTQHAYMTEDGWVWIVSQDVVDDLKDDFLLGVSTLSTSEPTS